MSLSRKKCLEEEKGSVILRLPQTEGKRQKHLIWLGFIYVDLKLLPARHTSTNQITTHTQKWFTAIHKSQCNSGLLARCFRWMFLPRKQTRFWNHVNITQLSETETNHPSFSQSAAFLCHHTVKGNNTTSKQYLRNRRQTRPNICIDAEALMFIKHQKMKYTEKQQPPGQQNETELPKTNDSCNGRLRLGFITKSVPQTPNSPKLHQKQTWLQLAINSGFGF